MAQPPDHSVAAIVSLDLHGYSRLTEQDEIGTHRAWMNCWRKQLTPIVDDHHGVIVKSTGDGALIRFSDAPAAVEAMIRFQEQITAAEARFPEPRRLVFRIGIHVAPTIHENGDVFGHGVNLAVRLQEATKPGAIFLSEATFSHLKPETRATLEDTGKQRFKNIGERVRVHCWRGKRTSRSIFPFLVVMRAAALLLLALIMPAATSEDIATEDMATKDMATKDMATARKNLKTFQKIGLPSRDISRRSDTDILAVTALSTRESAGVMPLKSEKKLAVAGSSAIKTEKHAMLDDEWIRPYHGLVGRPLTAPVRTTLAAAERSLENRFEIAEDSYLQALAFYGRHTPSTFAKAIDELDHALMLKPDYGAARALLAAVYWGGLQNRWQLGQGLTRDGMLGLAERYLTHATRSDPLAQMVASEMLTARGRHVLAIERAERVMARAPENAIGHYAKGQALLFAGRAVEAESPIRHAIRLDPHAPRYLFGLALAQFSMDRFDNAARTLARLNARNGDDDWPHLLMAATQGFLGSRADARQAIGRFDRLSLARRGWFASQIPYVHSWPFQNDRDRDRLHQGLILAGIPNKPR